MPRVNRLVTVHVTALFEPNDEDHGLKFSLTVHVQLAEWPVSIRDEAATEPVVGFFALRVSRRSSTVDLTIRYLKSCNITLRLNKCAQVQCNFLGKSTVSL